MDVGIYLFCYLWTDGRMIDFVVDIVIVQYHHHFYYSIYLFTKQ